MTAVNRATWTDHRNAIEKAGKELPLMEFAKVCDQMKDDFAKLHGICNCGMSNGRYEVHIQDVLKADGEVSEEDLKSVKWSDIQFDWYEFKPLIDACAKVGNVVEDVEAKKREKAMEWFRSLSYNEQDALIKKYVADDGYYFQLARAGNLSSYKVREIMEKEGA